MMADPSATWPSEGVLALTKLQIPDPGDPALADGALVATIRIRLGNVELVRVDASDDSSASQV